MQKYHGVAQNRLGRAISGASISVTNSSGAAATLYADNETSVLTQPLASDADGEFAFKAANGEYTVVITSGAVTDTKTVRLFDADDAGIVSVKDYGAKGDGTTNDVAAINAAITAVNAAGGGVVFFPEGTYMVSVSLGASAIIGKSNVTLRGAGVGATTIKLTDSQNGTTISGTSISNFAVEHMTIDGNRATNTGGHGVRGAGVSQFRVSDCEIKNCGSYGIGCQDGAMVNVTLRDLYIHDVTADGIDFKNKDDANENIIIHNVLVDGFDLGATSGKAGIDVRGPANISNVVVLNLPAGGVGIRFRNGELGDENGLGGHMSHLTNFRVVGDGVAAGTIGVHVVARNVTVSNGYIEGTSIGVRLTDAKNTVSNVHIKGTIGDGINLAASTPTGVLLTPDDCTFVGCVVETSGDDAVYLEEGSNLIFSGCRFIDNTGWGFRILAPVTNSIICGNYFNNNTDGTITNAGTNVKVYGNLGHVSEAVGTGTIASGATSVAVTHGITGTPALGRISIIGGEDPTNNIGAIWISAIGGTTFTVNVENDPGASGWDFGWRVAP